MEYNPPKLFEKILFESDLLHVDDLTDRNLPDYLTALYTNENGERGYIILDNYDKKENLYEYDGYGIIITDDEYEKFCDDTVPLEPPLLKSMNAREYYKLSELIYQFSSRKNESLTSDSIVIESLEAKIESLNKFKKLFIKWFFDNNTPIPSFEEFELPKDDYKKPLDEDTSKTSVKKDELKLKSKDAFKLLEKFEKGDWTLTSDEEKIINHPSFGSYKSTHIKKLVKDRFDSVFGELLKQGRMTHEKFHSIAMTPKSDFYKRGFLESFYFHCTNPLGKYYERFMGNKLEIDASIRDNGSRKSALLVK